LASRELSYATKDAVSGIQTSMSTVDGKVTTVQAEVVQVRDSIMHSNEDISEIRHGVLGMDSNIADIKSAMINVDDNVIEAQNNLGQMKSGMDAVHGEILSMGKIILMILSMIAKSH